jgi:hypothetical protein
MTLKEKIYGMIKQIARKRMKKERKRLMCGSHGGVLESLSSL